MAAGVVPAASGGDGTGSIRVPASCCGLVGLKPRRGRTSFAPGAGHGLEGLVNEHALTRTVRDSAALLDAVTGSAPGDPYTAPAPKVPFLQAITQQRRRAADPDRDGIAVSRADHPPRGRRRRRADGPALEGLGHIVEPGAPTIDADAVADAIAVLHTVSNAQLHAMATAHLGREPDEDEFEPSTWVMVREGFTTSGVAYAEAIGAVHAQTRRFAAGMAGHDVLLVPTLLTPPPPYAPAGPAARHDAGVLRRRVRHHGMDIAGECDRLGGDLAAARGHVGRPADRCPVDGARRDDPAPARRAARSRRAMVTAAARLCNVAAMVRDIRELTDSPDAYAAELRARWGGLLSYRYIGRSYASMDLGPEDNTVTLRRDMRNPTGGLLLAVLGIASPEGGHMSDLEAVPNPVIHSCQILDPGRDVRRIEIVSEELKRGRQMGYSRAKIVDADQPDRVLALTEGQGISIGTPPGGLERMEANPIEVVDSPDLPPLWQVFGGHRRPDGHWALPELAVEVASPDAALHIGPQFVILETAAVDSAAADRGHRPHPRCVRRT